MAGDNDYVVATGGSDGAVMLWDLRNFETATHNLQGHKSGVYQVRVTVAWLSFL